MVGDKWCGLGVGVGWLVWAAGAGELGGKGRQAVMMRIVKCSLGVGVVVAEVEE